MSPRALVFPVKSVTSASTLLPTPQILPNKDTSHVTRYKFNSTIARTECQNDDGRLHVHSQKYSRSHRLPVLVCTSPGLGQRSVWFAPLAQRSRIAQKMRAIACGMPQSQSLTPEENTTVSTHVMSRACASNWKLKTRLFVFKAARQSIICRLTNCDVTHR